VVNHASGDAVTHAIVKSNLQRTVCCHLARKIDLLCADKHISEISLLFAQNAHNFQTFVSIAKQTYNFQCKLKVLQNYHVFIAG
jgi:hypothetical protein